MTKVRVLPEKCAGSVVMAKRLDRQLAQEFKKRLEIQRVESLLNQYPVIRILFLKDVFGGLEVAKYFLKVEGDVKVFFPDLFVKAFLGVKNLNDSTANMPFYLLKSAKSKLWKMSFSELKSLTNQEFAILLVDNILRPLRTWVLNFQKKTRSFEGLHPRAISKNQADGLSEYDHDDLTDQEENIETKAISKKLSLMARQLSNPAGKVRGYLRRKYGKMSKKYRLFKIEVEDYLKGSKRSDKEYSHMLRTTTGYIRQVRCELKRTIKERFGINWHTLELHDKV